MINLRALRGIIQTKNVLQRVNTSELLDHHNSKILIKQLHTPNDGFERQGAYEGPGKTTVSILNQELHGVNMIDSFSSSGFRLNDNSVLLGPSIVFPTTVLRWNVEDSDDITEESLALFTLLDPRPDIIIIGHGQASGVRNPVDVRVILCMKQKGITLEVLTTENAISTYNYLLEEGRVVAAALIPPAFIRTMDETSRVAQKKATDTLYKPGINPFGMSRAEKRKQLNRDLKEVRDLDRLLEDPSNRTDKH